MSYNLHDLSAEEILAGGFCQPNFLEKIEAFTEQFVLASTYFELMVIEDEDARQHGMWQLRSCYMDLRNTAIDSAIKKAKKAEPDRMLPQQALDALTSPQ